MPITDNKEKQDYSSAFAIADSETIELLQDPIDLTCLQDSSCQGSFLTAYREWITTTTLNRFLGLDRFVFSNYSNGTTESFDKFYQKNSNRRFRCFKGEYMYHQLAWRTSYEWCYIEEDQLRYNDAVVISVPFANSGNMHPKYNELMNTCVELEIPVLVDCAYFGLCSDIIFDLSYSCIKEVVFSLSKTFPVAHARIGMRLSIIDDDDSLFVYDKIQYTNRIGQVLGLRYLEKFSPDFIYKKYKQKQLEMCKKLDVIPSQTVIFGLGGEEWSQYNRGGKENRLSFHRQFEKG